MSQRILLAAAAALFATAAIAQTPAPVTTPTTPTTPMATPAPATVTDLILNDTQAKSWIDKVVYSSDGQNLGEVAAFARDASGKVQEIHLDIGGFLGMGETRVRVTPAQVRFDTDRVVLNMSAEAAKSLPQIAK